MFFDRVPDAGYLFGLDRRRVGHVVWKRGPRYAWDEVQDLGVTCGDVASRGIWTVGWLEVVGCRGRLGWIYMYIYRKRERDKRTEKGMREREDKSRV